MHCKDLFLEAVMDTKQWQGDLRPGDRLQRCYNNIPWSGGRTEQGKGSGANPLGMSSCIFFFVTISCLLSYICELPTRFLNFLSNAPLASQMIGPIFQIKSVVIHCLLQRPGSSWRLGALPGWPHCLQLQPHSLASKRAQ